MKSLEKKSAVEAISILLCAQIECCGELGEKRTWDMCYSAVCYLGEQARLDFSELDCIYVAVSEAWIISRRQERS